MNPFFNSFVDDYQVIVQPTNIFKKSGKLRRRKTRRSKKKKPMKSAKWQKEFADAIAEQKKMKKIPSMSYRLYMGSAYWLKRRAEYFKKHKHECAVCKMTFGIALHHKVYDSKLYGREPDEHLVALCQTHHNHFHEVYKLKANMADDTDEYINTMRQYEILTSEEKKWVK